MTSTCGPWEANCYLVGASDAHECVIVDAGMDAAGPIGEMLKACGRTPVAVLATHGHLDHVADARTVADAYGIPVYIHAADRHLLTSPAAGLGPAADGLVEQLYGRATFPEPQLVREWAGGDMLELAGLQWQVLHTPGHTPGSVVLFVAASEADDRIFTGDVLFAGSIGRTDLPGGSMAQMRESLIEVMAAFRYATEVFPGHGPTTTIGSECIMNPYFNLGFLQENT